MSKPKFPGAERRFQSSNQSSRLAKQRRQDLSDDLSFPVAAKRSRKGLYPSDLYEQNDVNRVTISFYDALDNRHLFEKLELRASGEYYSHPSSPLPCPISLTSTF